MKRGGKRGGGSCGRMSAPRMAMEGFCVDRSLVASHRRLSRQCRIIVKRRGDGLRVPVRGRRQRGVWVRVRVRVLGLEVSLLQLPSSLLLLLLLLEKCVHSRVVVEEEEEYKLRLAV